MHLERRQALLAHLRDLLKLRHDHLHEIYVHVQVPAYFNGQQLQLRPDPLKERQIVSSAHGVPQPMNELRNQRQYLRLHQLSSGYLDEPLAMLYYNLIGVA